MSVWSQDVNPDGTFGMWNYNYSDTIFPPTSYFFHSASGSVRFDSTHATGVGSGFIGRNWFNSDVALISLREMEVSNLEPKTHITQ